MMCPNNPNEVVILPLFYNHVSKCSLSSCCLTITSPYTGYIFRIAHEAVTYCYALIINILKYYYVTTIRIA